MLVGSSVVCGGVSCVWMAQLEWELELELGSGKYA